MAQHQTTLTITARSPQLPYTHPPPACPEGRRRGGSLQNPSASPVRLGHWGQTPAVPLTPSGLWPALQPGLRVAGPGALGLPQVEPAQSAQGPESLGVCTLEPQVSSALGCAPTGAEQDPSRQLITTADPHTPGPQPLWSKAYRRFHGRRKETLTSGGGPGPEEEDAESQGPESQPHGPTAASLSQLPQLSPSKGGDLDPGQHTRRAASSPSGPMPPCGLSSAYQWLCLSICGRAANGLAALSFTRLGGGPSLRVSSSADSADRAAALRPHRQAGGPMGSQPQQQPSPALHPGFSSLRGGETVTPDVMGTSRDTVGAAKHRRTRQAMTALQGL